MTDPHPAQSKNQNSVIAYLGLGSNLGNRAGSIQNALHILNASPGVKVDVVSSLIDTSPVGGPPGQGPCLNGAAQITTSLSAEDLLGLFKDIETRLGREPQHNRPKWGPRPIDLDLLLYSSETINRPHLTVPHPLMHTRHFVLEPLAEIAPDVIHPILNRSIQELLDSLPAT